MCLTDLSSFQNHLLFFFRSADLYLGFPEWEPLATDVGVLGAHECPWPCDFVTTALADEKFFLSPLLFFIIVLPQWQSLGEEAQYLVLSHVIAVVLCIAMERVRLYRCVVVVRWESRKMCTYAIAHEWRWSSLSGDRFALRVLSQFNAGLNDCSGIRER